MNRGQRHHIADDIDVAVTDVAGDGAHQVGEEERRPLEDAEEEDFGLAGILADLRAQPIDPLGDLLLAECLLDSFPQWQPRRARRRR